MSTHQAQPADGSRHDVTVKGAGGREIVRHEATCSTCGDGVRQDTFYASREVWRHIPRRGRKN